jgi:hypothetical protein
MEQKIGNWDRHCSDKECKGGDIVFASYIKRGRRYRYPKCNACNIRRALERHAGCAQFIEGERKKAGCCQKCQRPGHEGLQFGHNDRKKKYRTKNHHVSKGYTPKTLLALIAAEEAEQEEWRPTPFGSIWKVPKGQVPVGHTAYSWFRKSKLDAVVPIPI